MFTKIECLEFNGGPAASPQEHAAWEAVLREAGATEAQMAFGAEQRTLRALNVEWLRTDDGQAYWALLDRRDEVAMLLACLERAWVQTSASKTREELDALRRTREELGDLDRQLVHFEPPAATAAAVAVAMRGAVGSAPATTAVSRTAIEQAVLSADEPTAHPTMPAPPSPSPLTTPVLALLLDGIVRHDHAWRRLLADCPVWLRGARLQAGSRGKVSALWDPVAAASKVMTKESKSVGAMRAAFVKASRLSPEIEAWLPAWRAHELDLSWGTGTDS